jgi:hypothetical protein
MSYNVPVQILQGGSVLNVASGGTLVIAAGGSIQNAGGQSSAGSQVFSGSVSVTGVIAAPAITLGGTIGKWSFGTATLTSGVGTLGFPGFTRVMSANANIILGEASGLGSPTSVHTDYTLAGAGSVIFRAVAGTIGYAANVNIGYNAFGT